MSTLVVYEDTGNIVSVIPEYTEDELEVDGFNAILSDLEGLDPNTHYVRNGDVLPQTPFNEPNVTVREVNSEYEIAIRGIPKGSSVLWPDGQRTDENDGVLFCDVAFQGTYRFVLLNPAHQTKEIAVHVKA
jgi:hypothetical protein